MEKGKRPDVCRYCGGGCAGDRVCAACRPLDESDPLGADARRPIDEARMIAAWRPPAGRGGPLPRGRGRRTIPPQ